MVRAALAGAGKTQKELAEHMGWTPQNLSGRLKNNSLTFDELSKALHFAGYEVSMSDANGAGLPELGNSTSPAVAQTVDGVRYDTRKAESLCSNKVVMFEDFYIELFEDAARELLHRPLPAFWMPASYHHPGKRPCCPAVLREVREQSITAG